MQRTLAGSRHIRHSHFHHFLQYPLVPSDFLRLTQRKGTRNPQAPPWHCPPLTLPGLLFPEEEPVSIRNSAEHCALHNTQGVVTLHSALHLQAKHHHTQLNQKPAGALANHSTPMSYCRTELARHFSISINQNRPWFRSWSTSQKSFQCHSRSFSDLCCHHSTSN